jgi:GT2 family glycosyltransferase
MAMERIVGYIERLDATGVEGFIVDVADPLRRLTVAVWVDGAPLVRLRPMIASPAVAQTLGFPAEALAPTAFRYQWPVHLYDDREHRIQLYCQQNGALLARGDRRIHFPKPGISLGMPSKQSVGIGLAAAGAETARHLPRVSIVVLNRNGASLLPRLFESFLRYNTAAVEWIVIDHASRDESLTVLAAYQERLTLTDMATATPKHEGRHLLSLIPSPSPQGRRGLRGRLTPTFTVTDMATATPADESRQSVPSPSPPTPPPQAGEGSVVSRCATFTLKVVALDHNDSFSASCNRGAALAQGELLLFLNNDIVWVQDALPIMVDRLLADETVGAVGLKLVKEEEGWLPEVQHLGVRFTRVFDRYWPYEVDPHTDAQQPGYSPAVMPAVTGAALLIRKRDFDAIGGFDERYFYGYEDVDLCLRLERQLGKRSLCCNDLVAIHRHGYTRLSGREQSVTDRLQHNADHFAEQWGAWLKQEMRRRRLEGDRVWFSRPLQAYILVEQHDDQTQIARQKDGLAELIARWQKQLPWAEWRVVLSTQPWQTIVDADLLLVTSERFDLREMPHLPPDAICLACTELGVDLAAWQKQPWWWRFHGLGATPLELLARQLRIGIWLPIPKVALQTTNPHVAAAHALRAKLAAAGAFAAVLSAEEDHHASCQLDAILYAHLPRQPLPTELRRDVLRLLWARAPIKKIDKSERRRFDFIWRVANPGAADVRQILAQITALWERRLGYPLHSS